jgi:hypothetical protein
MKTNLQIYIDVEDKQFLQTYCKDLDISVNKFVLRLITNKINELSNSMQI